MDNRRKISLIIGIAILVIIGILMVDRHREDVSINEKINEYQKSQTGYIIQVAQKVEMTFSRLFSHLYLLSQSPQVQILERNTCLLNLVRTYELNSELISGIYRYDNQHVLRYGYPLGNPPIPEKQLKPFFEEGRMTGKQLTRVIRAKHDGSDFLVIAQPVFTIQGKVHFTPSNKYAGTVIFVLTLDRLQTQLFPQLTFGARGYPWIINKEGLILVSGNDDHRGRTFAEFLPREMVETEHGVEEIVRKMMAGANGSGVYRYYMHNNIKEDMFKLASYVPVHLPSERWSVAVSTPLHDVTSSLSKRNWEQRFATFIALLVVISMTVILIGGLHRGYRQKLYYLEQREEEERTIKRQWQQTFDAIDNMIFLLDNELRIIRLNQAAETMVGKDLAELQGLVISDLLWNGEDDEKALPFRLAQTTHSRQTARVESPKLNRVMLITVAPVEAVLTSKVAFVCSIKDITDLEKMHKRLNNVSKMEALATLAGGVAHDLNNILSGVVTYPELLLLGLSEDDPMRKPLLTIQNSGRRAVAVVRDLSLLAHRGVYEKSILNLNAIIEEFLTSSDFAELQQMHSKVEVERLLAPDLENLKGSPLHLKTVVMNITKNGIEAVTGAGRITLTTENVFYATPPLQFPQIKPGPYVQLVI